MKRLARYLVLPLLVLNIACQTEEPVVIEPEDVPEEQESQKMDDGILSIIAIGNSYSKGIVVNYLRPLFENEGYTVNLCNMHVSSCSLAEHLKNATGDVACYEVWRGETGSQSSKTLNLTLGQLLDSAAWDYVVFQQYSALSGQYQTYQESLSDLMSYVRMHVPEEALFAWHQTWAYETDYASQAFEKYNNDQQTMYNAIMDASSRVMKDYEFELLVPAGTTVQNLRRTSLVSEVSDDGTHLKSPIGQYAGACVWFEAFTGVDARTIKYKPSNISDADAAVCRWAAHAAIISPFAVTLQ